ncbi:MAG TPA: ABC transporter permease [Methylomusa anaerophila]|uniref:Putative aliphatic sulfonates transport permease protein SsuC n=1 Tax=Methylomusa anaerophila TaxID=1930071 RepID=A0A348AEN8_9FIRM|nr:ABC transporter permease [Methylomusa anaerophila]BBB89536.1 putative aliphatic sulfonates transport permease protein SsuC [Methylomusa anaerophila]HML90094.1 ABC transporter permease [Methylomusa anaerophila]
MNVKTGEVAAAKGGNAQTLRLWLERLGSGFERAASILVVLLVWEVLPRAELIDRFILPTFSDVISGLAGLFITGEMFKHIAVSFGRAFTGFIAAVSFSIILGIFMGWFKRLERYVNPLLELGRNTPILALYPVFIMFFGVGEVSKVAIIFWGTIWPILLNTIGGVKNVDPLLIKSARSMGISLFPLFRKVILPAATPAIITGLRLSATTSILILVAAEMLNANAGLGFMIFYNETKYKIPEMYSGIITLSILGFLINYLLIALENRLTRWKEQAN